MNRVYVWVRTAFLICIAFFSASLTASAGTFTWSGGAGAIWSVSSTNWNAAIATPWDATNGPTDIADFTTPGATPSVSGTIYTNGIIFDNTATVSGGIINLAGTSPFITTNANASISSTLAGSSGLLKNGTGTLTISALTSYTGPTTVNAGTLLFNVGAGNTVSTYPTGTLTVNSGAVLGFASGTFYQLGGWNAPGTTPVVVNAGGIIQNGAGSIFALNNLTLAGGSLNALGGWTAGNNWGAFNLFGTLNVTANSSINNVSGINNFLSPGSQNGSPTLTINVSPGATLTNNLPIEDYGASNKYALTETGSGTVILAAANTYTGATTISGGSLMLGSGGTTGSFATASAISIANGATLVFNRSNNVTQGTDFTGNAITGAGGVTKLGGGTLSLFQGNTFTGPLTVSGGLLNLGNAAGTFNSVVGSTSIIINSSGTLASPGYLAGSGSLPPVTVNAGGTVMETSGIMQLNNLTLNSGTALIASGDIDSGWGSMSFGGTLTATGNSAIKTTSGSAGTVSAGNNVFPTLTILTPAATDSLTISSNISTAGGVLSMVKQGSGIVTLTGAGDNYTGATTVSTGTLGLLDTTSFASVVTVNNGAALNLAKSVNGFASRSNIAKQVTGSGVLNINSPSSGINGGWILFNTNTYGLTNFTGTVNVNSGVLSMDSTVGLFSGNPTLNVMSGGLFGIRDQNISIDALTGNGDVMNDFNGDNGAGHVLTIGANNGSGTFTGIIHGSAVGTADGQIDEGVLGITKVGTGTQVLTGVNSYSGGTIVQGGVLNIAGGAINSTNVLVTQTAGSMSISNASVSVTSGDGTGIGFGAVGIGAVTVGKGGTLNVGNGGGLVFIGGGGSGGPYGTGTLNINSGGLVNVGAPGGFPNERIYFGGYGGNGYMNINGGTLSTARDIFGNSAGTVTLNGAYLQAAAGYSSRANNGSDGSGAGFLSGQLTCYLQPGGLTVNSNGFNLNVSAALVDGGGGGFTKVGAGQVTLSSNGNSFSGNTLVSAGTLNLTTTPALLNSTLDTSGSGVVTFGSPGTYTFGGLTGPNNLNITTTTGVAFNFNVGNNNQTTTYSGNLTGLSGPNKVGSGSLTLTGSNTYSGATSVSAGTLTFTPQSSVNMVGAFTVSGSNAVANIGGTITRSTGTGQFSVRNGGIVNFSGTGNLGATGGAIIIGDVGTGVVNVTAGSLLFSASSNGFGIGFGANATGALNISGGTVSLGNTNDVFLVGVGSTTATGAVTVSGGGVLNLGDSGQIFIGGGSSGGNNYGTGTLTIGTGGLVTVGVPGAFPNQALYLAGYGGTGTLNLNGGTLSLARPIANGGNSTVNFNGGTLVATASNASLISVSNAYVQDGGLTVNDGGYNVTISQALLTSGSGVGGLTKLGGGTLTLGGANTYGGGTTVNAGLLQATIGSALGTGNVTLSGGSLGLSGVTVPNNVTVNSGAISAIGTAGISGNITGSGLTKVGPGVLNISGTNTYSGRTVISAGTLRLSGAMLPAGTTIMPIGDSITYGTGGTNAGYRGFLYSDLLSTGSSFQFVGTSNANPGSLPSSPVNQQYHDGFGGWTTGDVLGNNLSGANAGQGNITTWLTTLSGSGQLPIPSAITMMIGTNDAANNYTVSQGTSDLSAIIDTAFSLDPSVKFYLGLLTPRVDANTAWVNSYNALIPGIVAQKQAAGDNITLVDLNTNFPSNGLTSDNLHPNDTGYAFMASQWASAILASATTGVTSAIPLNSPTTVAAGATFDLAGNSTQIGPLDGAGSITLGSGNLTINSTASSIFAGTISGPGSIRKIGANTLTLGGPNTYTGATSINVGTLALGLSGSLAGSSIVAIAASATLDATAAAGGYSVPFGQTLTGLGTAVVGTSAALTLSSGAVISGGSNGVGTLTIAGGSLTLNSGSILNFGASAPGVNSQLSVLGALNLAGPGIAVNLYQAGTNSFFNTDGTYPLIAYGSLVGSTSSLYSSFDLSKVYSYSTSGSSLVLTISDGGPVWTGLGGTTNWSDSGNWSTNAPPTNGQALVFDGTNTTNINNIGSLHATGLQFNAGAGSFTLTGGSIQLSTGLNNLSPSAQTIALNVQLGSNLIVNDNAGQITVSGVISDGGAGYGITKSGSGAPVLTASNSYTGPTNIDGGTLQLGNGTADGSVAGSIIDNGSLYLLPATTVTLPGAISGSGSVYQTGPGATVLTGNSSYGGITSVTGGTLTIAPASTLSTSGGLSVSNATMNLNGAYLNNGVGSVQVTNSATLNIGSSGTLNSGTALTVNGSVLNLNGAYINGGTGLAQVTGSGAMNVNGSATFNGSTSELWVGNSSAGTLAMTGGTMLFNSSGASGASPSGGANGVALAGLRVGNGAGGAGVMTISAGLVTIAGSDEFDVGYSGATGVVTVNGGTLSLGNGGGRVFIGGGDSGGSTGSGTLTINNGGTVTVAGSGTFPNERMYLAGYGGSGTVILNGGLLSSARIIGSGSTNTLMYLNGGTLQAGVSDTNFLNLTHVYLQAGTTVVDTQGFSDTIATGLVHDPALGATLDGGLTKVGTGTLSLNGANTFTGPLTINAGILKLQGGTNLNFLAGSPIVTVNSGATLAFTNYNTFGVIPSTMSPVTVNPGGTILSSNTVTCFNNLTINSGTVSINGNNNYDGGGANPWGSLGFGGVTTATGSAVINVVSGTGTIETGNGYTPTFTVLTPAATDSLTVSAPMQNAMALVKQGLGTLTLAVPNPSIGPTNSFSGSTTVSAGALVAGALNTLSPNSDVTVNGGTLDVTGYSQTVQSLTMGSVGALNISIGNLLTSSNLSSLSGILNVYGSSGGSVELISFPNSYTGTFGTVNASGYNISYQSNEIDLLPIPATPTWTSTASGSWTVGTNWSTGISPTGQGALALMGTAPTTPTTVSLDAAQTLGTLTFNNTAGYTLTAGSAGSLTLDNTTGTGDAKVVVLSGSHSILAPLTLAGSNTNFSLTGNGKLGIAGNIADGDGGNAGLTLSSADATGLLVLSGTNSFGGGATAASGTLVLDGAASLLPGSSLTIGSASPGAVFAPPAPSLAVAPSLAPVPEPSTFALLGVAALWSAVVGYRFSRRPANLKN